MALERGGVDGDAEKVVAEKAVGRRRRARRRAQALVDAALSVPIGQPPAEVQAQAPAEQVAEPVRMAQPEPEPKPPEPHRSEPDDFRDLLGQAVGLRVDNVSREFGTGGQKVTALSDVSLEIAPGEFVSVVGPSGCGKTTLLSLLGGLDHPTSGQVYAAGLALDQLTEEQMADYRLQRVSTIFQTFNLVPAMSAEENVALPLVLAGAERDERRERARRLLELVGLEGRSKVRAGRLSGGEQQKVAVARALAMRPGLILADEPTGSLDSAAGERILDLLKDLHRRGATVVLVTHDPEVARHAQRAVRMVDGRAIELGSDKRNVRNQDPVLPPARLQWRDRLRLGFLSAGRRPLRTFLTTTGVAIGIAAMSLIVALAGGLAYALTGPGLAQTRLNVVSVRASAASTSPTLEAPTLAALSTQPHVKAAWGDVSANGSFSLVSALSAKSTGQMRSLPPHPYASEGVKLTSGRMPTYDAAPEVIISAGTAAALGLGSPDAALGQTVVFTDAVAKPLAMTMKVVGVTSDAALPAGVVALAPYNLMTDHWSSLATLNKWTSGEFSTITLLADSDTNVDAVRDRAVALGFQALTNGDDLRALELLLGRLRIALLGLSLVALLLACLGIANTMYTAVLERTREIGILKAVGARSRDIKTLFVTEAAVIGVAGGILGGAVAAVLARAGNSAVDAILPPVASIDSEVFRPDLVVALIALGLAVLLSVGSGLLPAIRAAAQDPMKALHHE